MLKVAFVFATLALAFRESNAVENLKGVISLNSGTFDKVVNKYKAVLVKFDKAHPYGDKQNAFKALAEDCTSQPELIIADVLITDYGQRDNDDLRERFNIKKEDYPHYKLFVKDRQDPVDFKGNPEKTEELKEFIIAETGLWLGLPACIEEFDNLARGYFTAPSLEDRKNVVETAKKRAEAIKEEPKRSRALYYAKTLERLAEKGDNYITDEVERVNKLLDGKLSEQKKAQLKERSSILASFQLRQKDEL